MSAHPVTMNRTMRAAPRRQAAGRTHDSYLQQDFSPRDGYAEDDGNPARGVMIGLALSAPLWAAIGGVAYWLF